MPTRILCILTSAVFLAAAAFGASPAGADEPGDDAVLRDYYSGNGLLNRGLYDLAAAEYHKFLDQHGDHAKAPTARYGLAVSLFKTGKLDEAAKELTSLAALRDFEFSAETALLLGQCRMAKGDHAAAAEILTSLLAAQPKHALAADATALLVEALYLDKKYETIEEKAKNFAEAWPSSPAKERVTLLRGLALMARSQWAAAAERLAELLRGSPAGPLAEQAEFLQAQCQEQRGAEDEAVRCYQAVASRQDGKYVPDALLALAGMALRNNKPQDVSTLLDRMSKIAPDGPQLCTAKLLRARAALALDRHEEAIKLLRDNASRCEERADQFAYWLAKTKLRKGEYGQAAKDLGRSIRKYPQSTLIAEMSYDRAVALAQAGDDDAAAKAAEEFVAHYAKHELEPEALFLLATLEHRRQKYDRSEELCRSLLERFPQHPRAVAAEFLSAENMLLGGSADAAAKAYQKFIAKHPQDPQAATAGFRLGAVLYRRGRFEEATAPLEKAAELADREPRFRESLLMLGDLYLQRSEWKKAEAWLSKYVAKDDAPAADEALLKLGLALSRQALPEKALESFDRLVEKYPKSDYTGHAVFERGQALLALGRTADAAAAFERVLASDGDGRFKPYASRHLGVIALQNSDFETAAKHFAGAADGATDEAAAALAQQGLALLAAENYPEAEKVLRSFLERFPEHEQAAASRARLAMALSRQDKTADAMRIIEQVERSDASLDGELRSGLRYEKAWCLRKQGKPEEATAAYRSLLSEKGGAQRGYAALELAELLAASGKCEEAQRLLQPLRASSEDFASLPSDEQARLLYRAGVCAFESGKDEEALAALEQLLKNAPRNALAGSACFFCGEACFRLRRFTQAAEYYDRVVEEQNKGDSYGPSLLRLGECLAALGRWPRSEEAFARYLRELPTGEQWYQAQFGVGWARENLGRHEEAIAAYRPVVERHRGPTAARAQFQIGECLFAKKRYQEAAAELLKVEILYDFPEWSAGAVYEAGRCFEELNKTAEAKKQFEAVREKYGQTRWAEMAARRLAESVDTTGLPERNG